VQERLRPFGCSPTTTSLLVCGLALTLSSACATSRGGDDNERADEDGWVSSDDGSGALPDDAVNGATPAPDVDDERVLAAVRTARSQAEAGDASAAFATIEAALAKDAGSPLLHLERGQLGLVVGLDEAEVERSLVFARDGLPENPRAHFALAAFDEGRGRVDDARRGYERTLAIRAEHGDANLRLGRMHLAAGSMGPARVHLEQAARAMPSSIPAQLALADVAERAGDLPGAERALLVIVNAHPSVPSHRQRLIAFYRRTGQAERERDALRALERIAPKDERKLRDLKRSSK